MRIDSSTALDYAVNVDKLQFLGIADQLTSLFLSNASQEARMKIEEDSHYARLTFSAGDIFESPQHTFQLLRKASTD